MTEGPEVDLAGDLAELTSDFLVTERLFEASCAARSGQPVSSLVSAGRGGLPTGPEQALPGFYLADRAPGGQIAGEQPSRAGDELPRETGEVAPIVAFLERDG